MELVQITSLPEKAKIKVTGRVEEVHGAKGINRSIKNIRNKKFIRNP